MHKMLPRLLAIADDVDTAILLDLQREERRVALAFSERDAIEAPSGPQFLRLGEPGRFRQAAGDCRFEHRRAFAQPRSAAGSLKLVTPVPR